MALPLSQVTTERRSGQPVLAIYGTGGIGKTSLAAEFPNPLYLYTDGEEQPNDIEMHNAEIKTYNDLMDTESGYFVQLLSGGHDFKTVIIDSVDSFEAKVWSHTCDVRNFDSIDSNDKGSLTAFGKGYLAADEFWNDYISALRAVARSGINVVQIMHSEVKKFDDPVVDSYDRYQPKLQKRAASIITEKSDALLFISKRTSLKQVDKGFGKKESKPEGMSGSERIIYTDERAGFVAKNRLNMPASLVYRKGTGYAELSKYFAAPKSKNEE